MRRWPLGCPISPPSPSPECPSKSITDPPTSRIEEEEATEEEEEEVSRAPESKLRISIFDGRRRRKKRKEDFFALEEEANNQNQKSMSWKKRSRKDVFERLWPLLGLREASCHRDWVPRRSSGRSAPQDRSWGRSETPGPDLRRPERNKPSPSRSRGAEDPSSGF